MIEGIIIVGIILVLLLIVDSQGDEIRALRAEVEQWKTAAVGWREMVGEYDAESASLVKHIARAGKSW